MVINRQKPESFRFLHYLVPILIAMALKGLPAK